MATQLDKRINQLKPGHSLWLGKQTWVERSGLGDKLRFYRQDGNTTRLFKECRF